MKLGLGTVQFGLDYGYTNKNGIPTEKEIERIFDCALKNGVSYIDTANLYGNAEEIIGKLLPKKNYFKVITKTPKFKTKIIGTKENNDLEKRIFLQIIDFAWRSHLQYLEQLRQVIGLRSYGQKDPLSEFKKEAFSLFESLLDKIKNDIIKFLLNLNIVISNEQQKQDKKSQIPTNNKKVGRNEQCPCGSGKKYKHCCGSV